MNVLPKFIVNILNRKMIKMTIEDMEQEILDKEKQMIKIKKELEELKEQYKFAIEEKKKSKIDNENEEDMKF